MNVHAVLMVVMLAAESLIIVTSAANMPTGPAEEGADIELISERKLLEGQTSVTESFGMGESSNRTGFVSTGLICNETSDAFCDVLQVIYVEDATCKFPQKVTGDSAHFQRIQRLVGEREMPYGCPVGMAVSAFECSGIFCDNIVLMCEKLEGCTVSGSLTNVGPIFDDVNFRKGECPENSVIVGVKCSGLFCNPITLLCAETSTPATDVVVVESGKASQWFPTPFFDRNDIFPTPFFRPGPGNGNWNP